MTPFEFGYNIATQEKQAAGGAGAIARLLNAGRGLSSGARTLNEGAKHIVKGFGNVAEGVGKAVGTKARPTFDPVAGTSLGNSTGLGGLFLGTGRSMQQAGKRMISGVPGTSPRSMRDLYAVLGHGTRFGGSAVRGMGHATNLAGEGLQAVGRGLGELAQAQYGVPTLAAAGLLGGTAAVAPKVPLPGLKFQSPLDVNFSYKTRKPVEFEW